MGAFLIKKFFFLIYINKIIIYVNNIFGPNLFLFAYIVEDVWLEIKNRPWLFTFFNAVSG